jgi:predicted ATPase/class 3 adenylate cyclase
MLVFLFTDLEASTRLWEAHPQGMGPALALHDVILRDAVVANGGDVVKTTGDGLMATFARVSDCINACLTAQRTLISTDWGFPDPLRVRMGVHVGEAEPREGDYYGTAVNRAARIMAAGHGGQVLVSVTAAQLLGDALSERVQLRDLGPHRLKDLQQPEHIFQLTVPDLPADFPPLGTLETTPNNLPVQVSEFLGRSAELEAARSMLATTGVRLLTLTGPGGTGKTRLALQLAAEQLEAYPDGVYFVDLSAERDPDGAFEAVIRDLGLAGAREGSPLQTVKTKLREGSRLLVLDNFEQVTEAGVGVVELLQSCPGLEVVVTSREALRVRGEQVFPVPVLSLPDLRSSASLIAESEAAQLFVDRARSARPGFTLTDANAPAIAEITVQLDGLPLAIELAAARLAVFSITDLRDRLRTRVDVLGRGARDLPDRQRTLKSTIEWSYGLLDPDECRLFELMSVFSTARLEAIEEVAERAYGDIDVVEVLFSLVAKSLVRSVDVDGSRRFSMLRTIREHSAERLAARPEVEAAVRLAHARFFSRHAAGLRRALEGAEHEAALADLLEEIGNLRTAWRFWVEAGELEQLYLLLDGLWALIDSRGWYHAAVELISDLLTVLLRTEPSPERDVEEMSLRTSLARSLMAVRGFTVEVEKQFQRALALSSPTDGSARGPVLRALATYYMNVADTESATAMGQELLNIGQREGDTAMMVEGHVVVGASTFSEGLQASIDHLERAIELFDPAIRESGRLRLGTNAGVVARMAAAILWVQAGRPERAYARAAEGLELARKLGHPFSIAYALYHLGYLQLGRRKFEETRRQAIELAAIAGENDYPVWWALASVLHGVADCGLGAIEEGLEMTQAGADLYQGLTTPPVFWPLLQAVRAFGLTLAGKPEEALRLVDEAIAIVQVENVYPEFRVLRGDILAMLPDADRTALEEAYRAAVRGARTIGARLVELGAIVRLVELLGREAVEFDELATLYAAFTEGFDEPELVAARRVLGLA